MNKSGYPSAPQAGRKIQNR